MLGIFYSESVCAEISNIEEEIIGLVEILNHGHRTGWQANYRFFSPPVVLPRISMTAVLCTLEYTVICTEYVYTE